VAFGARIFPPTGYGDGDRRASRSYPPYSMADVIGKLLEDLWDPVAGRKVWEKLVAADRDLAQELTAEPDRARAILNFLIFSPISLEKICRRPELLEWLSHSDVQNSKATYRPSWTGDRTDLSFRDLRRWKSQEMLRIGFREINGLAGFAETTRDINAVAERCISEVYATCFQNLADKQGRPETGFCILAMGKFGGRELNYSSDIDVVFFYGDEGNLSSRFTYREFFTRLAESIVRIFSATADPLFRIDLRLRPEGSNGPLVRSLESMENYYAGYGETWERMALIKARGVAGDNELLYEFNQRLQPFIFPRTVSTDLLDEIVALKDRIEREIVGLADLHRNVKLGYGGIREIEFILQTLQLLHGSRNAFLQERNSLKTLDALEQLNILPADEVRLLREAYIFLRTVEHRLQIQNEQQTHTLPARREAWLGIAQTLGYDHVERFADALHSHTSAVRSVFDRLLKSSAGRAKQAVRDLSMFRDPESAARTLTALREGPSEVHVAPRTRALSAKLEPELLVWSSRMAEPDAALNRFVRFVDAYGTRGLLFETMLANPKLLELLIRLFDASGLFSEVIIRRPHLIEEITRGKSLGLFLSKEQFLQGLNRNEEKLLPLEWVRVYRTSAVLRILLRDVLGIGTQEDLQVEMTGLAEACLEYCCACLGGPDEITVLAMGKFGGQELLYGADLDVVFIGNHVSAGEQLIQAMAAKTAEGAVFPLDGRLRPDGEKGVLVTPLGAYREYFDKRAHFWEVQALTKARAVYGSEMKSLNAAVSEIWKRAGSKVDPKTEIAKMYRRIVKERAKGDDLSHFKTGKGGLIGIEFLVQYLQMKHQVQEPNTLRAIEKLTSVLDQGESVVLRSTYRFLRRVESVLRRVSNSSISQLPSNPEELRVLAVRLGFPGPQQFLGEYTARRTQAEAIIEEHF
jgi:[glutamine synthetase] adenylyltransferase / [glutamine synthetase]-adenylyl-L-tyrosine phosphorylase